MKRKTESKYLSNDVREVLEASRSAHEEAPDMSACFGMIANGCGRHEAAAEATEFISPLLLAA
jgi:hypothetical protein